MGQHNATARRSSVCLHPHNKGFHIGWAASDFFTRGRQSQYDAQWRASNYRSRPITDFLTCMSKFCHRITNVKTPGPDRSQIFDAGINIFVAASPM